MVKNSKDETDSPRAANEIVRCSVRKCGVIRVKGCAHGMCLKHCSSTAKMKCVPCKSHDVLAARMTEEITEEKCLAEGCGRMNKAECIFKFCSRHCMSEQEFCGKACAVHNEKAAEMAQKKEREAAYMEAAVNAANKRVVQRSWRFDHPEKSFSEYGQTVVIWCLQDFLRQPKSSADTLAQLEKKERYQQKEFERALQRGENVHAGVVRKTRRYYRARFAAIKRKWGV